MSIRSGEVRIVRVCTEHFLSSGRVANAFSLSAASEGCVLQSLLGGSMQGWDPHVGLGTAMPSNGLALDVFLFPACLPCISSPLPVVIPCPGHFSHKTALPSGSSDGYGELTALGRAGAGVAGGAGCVFTAQTALCCS